ncbi:reverse transcriptase domain-containing protein [Tanacetum coccineum]
MQKGTKVLKDLLSHKEKLEKVASSVKLSEECSAIIQRNLPQKEGDPGSFTLPCLIGPLAVKNALADLGASINLMPHSLFRQLGISKLKPTRMSIQLADRSIKYPIGVCENLLVKAVIDVHEGKLSLRVRNETVTFNIGKSMKSKHSRDDYLTEPVEPLEWKAPENRLKPSSVEPPKLELKELPEHLEYAFLQENNQLPVVISSALSAVEKARLLEVLKNHKGVIIWSIADIKVIDSSFYTYKIIMEDEFKPIFGAPANFHRRMTAIFHELIEDNMEAFMENFSIFGNSFNHCLKNLEKMLKTCEETNLVLNWEKCHFMVKEGIVLGHKVLGSRFDVDKAKIKAISCSILDIKTQSRDDGLATKS